MTTSDSARREAFDRFLTEIKPVLKLKTRIDLEKAVTEKELEVLRTKGEFYTKTIRKKISEAGLVRLDKSELGEITKDYRKALTPAELRQIGIRNAIADQYFEKNGEPSNVSVEFDHPSNLKITVRNPDEPTLIVDVVKSVEADIRNLHHPIISRCIYRYWFASRGHKSRENEMKTLGISRSAKTKARQCVENLTRISEAILAVKKENFRLPREKNPSEWLRIETLDVNYFETVLQILKSASIDRNELRQIRS